MTEAELTGTFPRLWHMAEDGSWPSIRAHGLLSTRALLDLYRVEDEARVALLSHRRPQSVPLVHAGLPGAVVRDQKPLSDEGLRRCLAPGLTPRQWYETLNASVFFWLSRERLRRLLGARAYRNAPQTILTLDTGSLVSAHRDRVRLSPINSGATILKPQPRGRDTFRSIADYDFAARRRGRRPSEAVVELLVADGVPDVAAHVLAVHRCVRGTVEELWRAPRASPDDGP